MYCYNKNNITINVKLIYKPNNKNIYLRYKNDILTISSSRKLKEKDIDNIIEDNIKVIQKFIKKHSQIEQEKCVHILGIKYKINIVISFENKIELINDICNVYTLKPDYEYIKKIFEKYYVEIAKNYIETKIQIIKDIFNDINTKNLTISYKYLKTCFGKCIPKENKIVFSGLCAKLEEKYIDYVIFHEFSHLKYIGHQKDFYNYLESKMKNAKIYQKEIRKLRYKDYF